MASVNLRANPVHSSPISKRRGSPAGQRAAQRAAVRQLSKSHGQALAWTAEEEADRAFLDALDKGTAGGNQAALQMLNKGQDVNVADEQGESAVHKAVRGARPSWPGAPGRQLELLRDLLRRGAHADHPNAEGATPLLLAAGLGDCELAKTLLDAGASLLARSRDGRTVLHAAVYGCKEAMVKMLLANPHVKASLLEERDADGRTPLLLASFRASKTLCALLVEAGADVNKVDKRANRPSGLAKTVGKSNSASYLLGLESTLQVALAATKLKQQPEKAAARRASLQSERPPTGDVRPHRSSASSLPSQPVA